MIKKLDRLLELSREAKPNPDEKQTEINSEFFVLCCELIPEMIKGCQNDAEWEIATGIELSYSCTDCLSDMVEAETTDIQRIKKGEWGKCNMVGTLYNERFWDNGT